MDLVALPPVRDRILFLKIIADKGRSERPGKRARISAANAEVNWGPKSPKSVKVLQTEKLYVSTAVLSAQSPFFAKLFSSWEKKPQQSTLTITISEEAGFKKMLQFLHSTHYRAQDSKCS